MNDLTQIEQTCIGILLQFPETYEEIIGSEKLFSNHTCRFIITTAKKFSEKQGFFEPEAFAIHCSSLQDEESISLDYLFDCRNLATSAEPLKYYLNRLREDRVKHELAEHWNGLTKEITDAPIRAGIDVGALVSKDIDFLNTIEEKYSSDRLQLRVWETKNLSDAIKEAENIHWIIRGWLARGYVTLISGPPKVGKSFLLLDMNRALQQGGEFVGDQVGQENVQMFSAEDSAPIIKDRLQKMPETPGDLKIVFDSVDFTKPDNLRKLEEEIEKHGISVMTIDPLVCFHSYDENSIGVASVLYNFKQIAQRTKCAFVIIHHKRKSGGKFGSGIRGSSAIFAAVDLSVEIDYHDLKSNWINATFLGRLHTFTDPKLYSFDKDTCQFKEEEKDVIEKFNPHDNAILDALEDGPLTYGEIFKCTNMSTATLGNHLNKLKGKGKIEHDSSTKKYQLAKAESNSSPELTRGKVLSLTERIRRKKNQRAGHFEEEQSDSVNVAKAK